MAVARFPGTLLTAAVAAALAVPAQAQQAARPRVPIPLQAQKIRQLAPAPLRAQNRKEPRPESWPIPPAAAELAPKLATVISLTDIGFAAGLRFSNLNGRRDVFVPVPQAAGIAATALALAVDDISAQPARRSLEILVNDRSVAAFALDGNSMDRKLRVPLPRLSDRDGFYKLSFVYSGAATAERCIDARAIGDSLTVRPESALDIEIGAPALDVATIAALLPRDVTLVLSGRSPGADAIAAALTIGRALKLSGRRIRFQHGFESLRPTAYQHDDRWTQGVILIGDADEAGPYVEMAPARVAGPPAGFGTLAAVRAGGKPALLVSTADATRTARLFASPLLPALRGVTTASIGAATSARPTGTRLTFDELGLAPPVADLSGRADIVFTIPTRLLPAGTRLSRLALDLMVAPDGSGEKAVASVFVGEQLLGSVVAASSEPTRFDLALPTSAGGALNVRVVLQRRSAQGDCRFEAQAYPAQLLGSSAIMVTAAADQPRDFAGLSTWWSNGVEIWLPSPALEHAGPHLALVTAMLAALSAETAPIAVRFAADDEAPTPSGPFIAVGPHAPAASAPRVHFDRGRVLVTDRNDRTVLDLAGFSGGAVAQLVETGGHPGVWLRPLASDGALPAPDDLRLDRGDVAFVDQSGVALSMSSERDTPVRVSYPDKTSWFAAAERFHPWIIGMLWALISVGFLFVLQRMVSRREAED